MTPEDDDIDADLRKLFADQRLNVPVGDHAVHSVVAGAKRRRRRRTAVLATGGALGVAAVLLAGGLFAGHVLPPNRTQAANPSGLATSSYLTPTPDQTGPQPAPASGVLNMPEGAPTVIGPTGYGEITMGLTAKQVQGTGLVNTQTSEMAGCAAYTYVPPRQSRPAVSSTQSTAKPVYVYLSTRAPSGVQMIVAPTGVTTPQGIGVGSPLASIRVTYSNVATQKDNVLPVPVPGQPGLSYFFTIEKDTVSSIALGENNAICGS
jgi:hypothetical protein